jgi:hypothetical protein
MDDDILKNAQILLQRLTEQTNSTRSLLEKQGQSTAKLLEEINKGGIPPEQGQVALLSSIHTLLMPIAQSVLETNMVQVALLNHLMIMSQALVQILDELRRAVPGIGMVAAHSGEIEIATKAIQSELLGRTMEGEKGIRGLLEDIRDKL